MRINLASGTGWRWPAVRRDAVRTLALQAASRPSVSSPTRTSSPRWCCCCWRLFFVQLGDHAAEREVQRRRYIDRRHARTEAPEYRQNRRDA